MKWSENVLYANRSQIDFHFIWYLEFQRRNLIIWILAHRESFVNRRESSRKSRITFEAGESINKDKGKGRLCLLYTRHWGHCGVGGSQKSQWGPCGVASRRRSWVGRVWPWTCQCLVGSCDGWWWDKTVARGTGSGTFHTWNRGPILLLNQHGDLTKLQILHRTVKRIVICIKYSDCEE
jgi:hypothetical protein